MEFAANNANYALADTNGEAASTTLSGLVVGRTYTYGVEWQQFQLGVFQGGQLAMTVNGVKKIFTSSGLDDPWQKALFTFVAPSTTATVTLGINGTLGSVGRDDGSFGLNNSRAIIAVDTLSTSLIETEMASMGESLVGTSAGDSLVGSDNADTFNIATAATSAAQGTDKVFAGAGNDTVIFNNNNAGVMTVDGGSGVNFLKLDSAATATSLDLTDAAVRARIKNFNSIDLTGTGNNTLKLNYTAVVALSGTTDVVSTQADESKMLVVSGNAGDTLNLVNLASWNVGAAQTAASLSTAYGSAYNFLASHTYKAYTLNGATVFVDQAITVATLASSTTASVAYSQAVTIDSLFAATFTDSNAAGTANATFKGVAITAAGTAAEVNTTNGTLGRYELSKDGGATWTPVAGGLTDTTAVYADKTALIRFAGASGVEAINPPNLTVRLIDNSGATGTGTLTAASTGNTVNASVNGGSTAFSGGNSGGTGDTVGINVTDPLVATIMNVELMAYNPATGGAGYFAGMTGAPAYVTGGTFTLHDKATDAVVFTRTSWDGGGFGNYYFPFAGIVVGQTYYAQLNYPSGASYRLKNSVTYNGPSASSTQVDFLTSPLVLDLNGDGVQTTDTAQGVQFDLSNSGTAEQSSWVDKHDGLLAIDLNGDGKVNNGAELFGNNTQLGNGSLAVDGWAALAGMDSNLDGKIDAKDANFDKLRLWVDADTDGVTDAGELKTLLEADVVSIDLNHNNSVTQQNGNVLQGVSKYTTASGETRDVVDVWLQTTPVTAAVPADVGTGVTTEVTAELLPADIVTEFNNKPYLLSDEELAALNPLGQAIDASSVEAQPEGDASLVGAQLVGDATAESAIAICTGVEDALVYSLNAGLSLDLTAVLKDMTSDGIAQVDLATDTAANLVTLTMADVLGLPTTNGMHQLMLAGAANDKLMLAEGEWTDTGNVVNQDGNNYAVYTGTSDSSAQLLIDQQMLQSQHNG